MADETEDKAAETDESGEQDNQPIEIPDDPEQLKALLISERGAAADLKAKNERLEESREELRVAKDFHADENERLRARINSTAPIDDNPPNGKKTKKDPFEGLNPVEILSEEDGLSKLAGIIKDGLGLVSQDELDRRAKQEREGASREAAQIGRVMTEYPDLEDANSALRKQTNVEFQRLKTERPDLDDPTMTELAATRAARAIGYDPKKPKENGKDTSAAEKDRLRRAAGGGGGGLNGKTGAVVVTDDIRKVAKKMDSGLDDAAIKRAMTKVQQDQRRA